MELYFWDIHEQHPDGTLIFGITNRGTIRIGDRFTQLLRKTADGNYLAPEPIDLQVSYITAYRRDLEMLPKGLGGALMVHPAIAFEIAQGDLLCGPDSERAPDTT